MPFCAPQIVYSNAWLNQTSAIALTTIFTPPADCLLRITLTGRVVDSTNSSTVVLQGWLNSPYDGTNPNSFDIQISGVVAQSAPVCTVECTSADVIKFETSFTSFSGTFEFFDAYLVIEQLA
jgi:hypothetical protein